MADQRRVMDAAVVLAAWGVGVLCVEVLQGRVTPPGGFTWLDYALMLCLPLGSIHASRWSKAKSLHFAYGAVFSLSFLVGYTSGGRFAFSLWDRNLWLITFGWCGVSIGSGLLCRWLGSTTWRRKVRQGHCPSCGYDLTGNVSGVCPECGTKIGAHAADSTPIAFR